MIDDARGLEAGGVRNRVRLADQGHGGKLDADYGTPTSGGLSINNG